MVLRKWERLIVPQSRAPPRGWQPGGAVTTAPCRSRLSEESRFFNSASGVSVRKARAVSRSGGTRPKKKAAEAEEYVLRLGGRAGALVLGEEESTPFPRAEAEREEPLARADA